MFGFKHTMNELEQNTNDHKVIRTRLYGRILPINGPNHLSFLYPHLLAQLNSSLVKELRNGREVSGQTSFCDSHEFNAMLIQASEGTAMPVAQTACRLASRLMSIMFFGETLSE